MMGLAMEPAMLAGGRERDAVVHRVLAELIAVHHLGVAPAELRVGPLQRHTFSLLFTLDAPGHPGWIVKVPKTDLRRRPDDGIFPLTPGDRELGQAEYQSLTLMAHGWRSEDVQVGWVRAVAYIEPFNAIVTERVAAVEVCTPYRRLALAHQAGSRAAGRTLASALTRFGTALARFHDAHSAPSELTGASLLPRLREYLERVRAAGARTPSARATDRVLERLADRRWTTVQTLTFKGIDIRNVLVAPESWLWLVDPGKAKRTVREADLARFLLTWRILFWGTPWFALQAAPHRSLEAAFLSTYDGGRLREPSLLSAYLLKELLKHWATACESLALKPWSRRRRRLVSRVYIDPLYHRQMCHLLSALA
jgi:hypothetical protein